MAVTSSAKKGFSKAVWSKQDDSAEGAHSFLLW